MRFLGTLLLGIVIGVAGFWMWRHTSETPISRQSAAVEDHVERSASDTTADVTAAMSAKLEALQLRAQDVRDELDRGGRVVRRKAKELGQSAADATSDARATVAIKAKLAADPDLSAMAISVNTTNGTVTLAGEVASPDQVGEAMLLALETDGVKEVTSTLQVSQPARAG